MTTTNGVKALTQHDKLAILKYLAGGRDLEFTAAATQLTGDQILDVALAHGHPDREKLAWAADIVQKNIDKERREGLPASTVRTRTPPPTPTRAPEPSRADRNRAEHPGVPRPGVPFDVLADLVKRGKASETSKTRTLADRLESMATDLRATLTAEDEDREARQKAKREQAEAAAEVARLTAQLAAAKAKLKPAKTTSPRKSNGTAPGRTATIRAWAVQQGIAVRSIGVLPAAIVEQYDKTHSESSA